MLSILEQSDSFSLLSSEDTAGHRNLQKLQDFYASCMNETRIATLGRQPLLDEIRTIVNLFPVNGSVFESLQNTADIEASGRSLMNATSGIFPEAFSEALGHLHKLGLNAFVSLTTEREDGDPGIAFVLYSGRMGLVSKPLYSVATGEAECEFSSIYDTGEVAKTLYLLMKREDHHSFSSSGRPIFPSEVPAEWNSTAYKIVLFENTIKYMTSGSRTASLQDLSNMTISLNMTLALQNALPDDVRLPSTISLHGSVMEYFDAILENNVYSNSPPLQIQNYLVWMVVKQMIRQIDPKYGQFLRPYNDLQQERWKYCADVVNSTMNKMVAPFFAQQVSSSLETAPDMVDSIRSQLAEAYGRAVGIDNSTKARGLRKLNNSLSFVGVYNVSITAGTSAELKVFYRNLTIHRNDYFGNRKNYAMWYTANALRGLQGFVPEDEQDLLPQSSYIRHSFGRGKIQVPAGSLRPPFFHDDYPEYVTFGSIGAMIAQRYTQMLDFGESDFPRSNLDFSTCDTSRTCQQRYCYAMLNDNIDSEYYRFPDELFANSVGMQIAFDAWQKRSHSDKNGT
ncbi:hypothetical protein BGZ68_007584 [Mortierella alpina]|nr:hypothetical protein BGZ68_007584 [Mortierella alpina]